jgi:hypothetical protein
MSTYLKPNKEDIPIDNIKMDTKNPRIRWAFDEQEPSDEIIELAICSDTNEKSSATAYRALKASIKFNRGVINPITVNQLPDGTLIAIEGNTRLHIYRQLFEENQEEHWATIPAFVYKSLGQSDIDAIRLSAHIVGYREWDAYSKARYLYDLSTIQNMSTQDIGNLCGGKNADIEKSIEAYTDMEKYHRPKCEELGEPFKHDRYSSYKELQKTKIKQSLLIANKTIDDFAEWVIKGKIRINADVRHLSSILNHKKASDLFFSKDGTAEEAYKLTQTPPPKNAKDLSLLDLLLGLKDKIDNIPLSQINYIKDNPEGELAACLTDVHEKVENVWELCSLKTE